MISVVKDMSHRLQRDLDFMLQANTELVRSLLAKISELNARIAQCSNTGGNCGSLQEMKSFLDDLVSKQKAIVDIFTSQENVQDYASVLKYYPEVELRKKARAALPDVTLANNFFPNYRDRRASRRLPRELKQLTLRDNANRGTQ